MPNSICETIRNAESNYIYGSTHLSEHVDWSMRETIDRIHAYLSSKHISGAKDALNRDKPFFNIVTAAVNVWYRATDLDRKDLRFVPTKQSAVVLAFVANVILQNWMNKARFGQFINQWGRTLAQYGSAVVKFVDKGDELVPTVIPWSRVVPDPVDFGALPRIEKFYKTPAQLKNMATPGHPDFAGYYMEAVEKLCDATQSRKTIAGQQKDTLDDFIPLYEVHGLLDDRLLEEKPDYSKKDNVKYSQQMHVVSFVGGEKDEYEDFCLFSGREKQDPYMLTHLIEEEGRSLSIGAVEYLFDSQWMQNHAMKAWKDNIDLASRMIFQTADRNFVGRNVLTAIETGDLLIHKENMPITKVPNDEYDLTNVSNFQNTWRMMANELVSTPDAVKGNTMPSGTPYSLGAYLGQQGSSLFELMTENKGLAMEEMMRTYVIPFIRKQLKNSDEIVAILDDAGIQEIDALYLPHAAVKNFNERTFNMLEESINNPEAPMPQPFDMQAEQNIVKEGMQSQGNKRFFKPDEASDKQWNEVFSDFEWDSIRVEVTNEAVDKQAVLQTLAALYTSTAQTDPVAANMILAKVMSETNVLSPLQVASLASRPTPTPQAGQAGAALSKAASSVK